MSDFGFPLPHVVSIPPYPPGRPIDAVAREFGLDPAAIVKLASNENPLGCSPKAAEALRAAVTETHLYPDFDCHTLRHAIAGQVGVAADHVLPGAGSSEIILLAARAWLDAERAAVIPQYAFQSYEGAIRSVGAEPIVVPVRDWKPDLDAMLAAAADPRVHLVYLATPNNPTGTVIPKDELERFAEALPAHVLLVLDEAYREFLPDADQVDIARLFARRRNLLVMRTFSKVYGLAALRVGYGIGDPELLALLRRLQLPFSVSAPAQAAAVAALGDTAFVETARRENETERARMAATFEGMGIETIASAGNFVLARTGDGAALARALMQKGVIVRPVANYGLPDWLRVSVGLPHENDRFFEKLREVRSEAPKASVA